jgi:hypothetical protein
MLEMRTEMIGPERAKELLLRNHSNRRISENQVKTYATMMSKGEWQYTPQGITISRSGNLIDGQTRLTAIIRSGVTIPLCVFIIDGHESALGIMMDRGKARSATDITGINKDSVHIANFLTRDIWDPDGGNIVSPPATKKFYDQHPSAFAWYEANIPTTHVKGLSEAAIRAALLVRYMAGSDWSGQFHALTTLDFNNMTQGTQTLYRFLIRYTNVWGCARRIKIFGLAYRISNPSEYGLARIPPIIDSGDAYEIIKKDIGK